MENFWYQRTDSHEKECKRWKETKGCLQLHSNLEMLVLQHKRFVFIVVDTNREDALKINKDAQIKTSML